MLKQRVSQIITRRIFGVGPEASLDEALELMRRERISCVPVLLDGLPLGIITERGLIRHMVGNGGGVRGASVRQVMSSPVTRVPETAFVYDALHLLVHRNIRHLVVVDDQGLACGVLTLSNLVDGIGTELFIEFQPVDRHMSRAVYAVEEDKTLDLVLRDMADKSFSCLLYARDGRPEGLITERDVVRLASEGAPLAELRLTQVMSSPVVTVPQGTPVHEVVALMRARHFRRVVVVDGEGRLAGLATQSNIIRSLESTYIRVLKQVIDDREDRLQTASTQLSKLSLYLDSILNTSIDMAIVATDEHLRIVFCNQCAEKILGVPPDRAVGRTLAEVHARAGVDDQRVRRVMDRLRAEGCQTFQFQRRTADGPQGRQGDTRQDEGQERWFQARLAAILGADGGIGGYVAMVRDITEAKRAEENIRFMAYHDILTGLPNRVSFEERLLLELAHAERRKSRLAVLVMDLDLFKEVNDTMGHHAGDGLLEEVARRLASVLRKSDTVARVGGDEFMAVLPSLKSDRDALRVVEKMFRAMATPVDVRGRAWPVRLSVGVAFYPEHGRRPDRLTERADAAMYLAKKHGRDNGGCNVHVWPGGAPENNPENAPGNASGNGPEGEDDGSAPLN